MKVVVIFEFDNIKDVDSPEASAIVQAITESCETMQVGFDASNCWVEDVFGEKKETFEIIKTNDGYMVINHETGEYVNDENGNNLFDDLKDAERIFRIVVIAWALRIEETK